MTTKETERKALAEIKKIVKNLGKDSYVGTAMQGVFEIAEENIRDDAAYSMQNKLDLVYKEYDVLYKEYDALTEEKKQMTKHTESLMDEIKSLKKQLDAELEWKPYDGDYSTKKYEAIRTFPSAKMLTDDEAKEFLYKEFGYAPECANILHTAPRIEINRHHELREVGEDDRAPFYASSDWYYVRFECRGMTIEVYDDAVHFV